jgi:hypothetical protein
MNSAPILNKLEEKFSLRTRDPAEAKIRSAKALAEIEERWWWLQQGVRALSHKECVAMAGEIYRRVDFSRMMAKIGAELHVQ